MLTSLKRAWRVYVDEKERTALATRLGPHLARDIGLGDAVAPRILPTLRAN